jgi:alkylation response protein AidB-like acyl-CoA dehydrogenase
VKRQLFWVLTAVCLAGFVAVGVPQVSGAGQQSNFQNIQVLTDLSDGDIQRLMMSWSQQLGGVTCLECHVQGDFASDEKPQKNIARGMARMVRALNQDFFTSDEFSQLGREADCYLCHKGALEIPPM